MNSWCIYHSLCIVSSPFFWTAPRIYLSPLSDSLSLSVSLSLPPGMGGNLRFKPAYNPYTEPSMEVFSFHPGLNKLVEVGNSGIFRPEMLLPMGLPEDVVVIAWGLSLER